MMEQRHEQEHRSRLQALNMNRVPPVLRDSYSVKNTRFSGVEDAQEEETGDENPICKRLARDGISIRDLVQ